ncbi:MAG TPA: OmpA family protein, partial [Terriglobales bacterium]
NAPEIGQVPAKEYDGLGWDVTGAKKRKRIEALPRETIGRAMVLFTTKTTATALVTDELQPVLIGDDVSIMAPGPLMAKATPPKAPTLECSASPETVQPGLVASIVCSGNSEDGRPLSYTFRTSAGDIEQHANTALLDTRQIASGAVTVTAQVMDDRDLTGDSEVVVHVAERPAAVVPVAASAGNLLFKRQSAYVDNRAKAMLDGIALRLQQDPNSTLTIGGGAHQTEKPNLAQARAENAKRYLTKEKGIDSTRVLAKPGKSSEPEAEVWMVPAGAQQPL